MEAGTQSALIMIWALFWMLVLSLMMVHPMFRATRIQIRRSLRLNLNRWRVVQHQIQSRMLRLRGRFLIRLGKSLLWLARPLAEGSSPPFWVRFLLNQAFNLIFMYLLWHLLFRKPMNWSYVIGFLGTSWTTDGVKAWWKRRKQRSETPPADNAAIKPAQEQRAEP